MSSHNSSVGTLDLEQHPQRPIRNSSRKRRAIEFAATIIVAGALLAATLYFVNARSVADGLRNISLEWAIAAGTVAILQVPICALRWQLVTRETGAPLAFRDTSLGFLEATFVNAFFPTLVASDGVRILRAVGSGAGAMDAFVGVVTDRLVALCGLAIAAGAGVFFLPGATDNPLLLLAIIGILPMFLIGVVTLDLLSRQFSRLAHWRIVRPFLELASHMRRLRKMPRLALLVIAISLLGHMACAGTFFILGSELTIGAGFWQMFALSAPILVYSAVPISIGGWGVREAVTAALFGLVGVSASSAVALSIAFGLVMTAVGLLCGLIALLLNVRRRGFSSRQHRPAA